MIRITEPKQVCIAISCSVGAAIVHCALYVTQNLFDSCPMMSTWLLHETAEVGDRVRDVGPGLHQVPQAANQATVVEASVAGAVLSLLSFNFASMGTALGLHSAMDAFSSSFCA